jgi:hypothetical protein
MAPCAHQKVVKKDGVVVYAACGLDIARWYVPAAPGALASPERTPSIAATRQTQIIMAFSLGVALLIVSALPMVARVIRTLGTLAHEIGHALCGWLLAHPSLPAFDLQYGGGITRIWPRSDALLAVELALVVVYLWTHRRNRVGCIVIGSLGALLGGCACTSIADLLFLEAGHVGLLLLSAIFLFRGLSGIAVAHAAERWLYAIIGWTLWMQAVTLCWTTAFDPAAQARYLQGHGNIDNDFVRIADDLGLGFITVVLANLALSLIIPMLVFVTWRWRAGIAAGIWSIVRVAP